MMPGTDGIEGICYIRAVDPEAKLIFRSWRFPDLDIIREALEAGANRMISYGPVRAEDLVRIVREVLANKPKG